MLQGQKKDSSRRPGILPVFLNCLPVFIVFCCLIFSAPVHSRTRYIKADGSGDAPTIQAGVDSAAVGDTVLVARGTYTDSTEIFIAGSPTWVNVYLYKNIKLLAQARSNVLIDGPRNGVAVYVENADSTASIEGFRIRTTFAPYACILPAKRTPQQYPRGIGILCRSSTVRIWRNEIFDHDTAVKLIGSSVRIEENHIHRSFIGIECTEVSNALILANRLHACAVLISSLNSSPRIILNKLYADMSTYEMVCDAISCYGRAVYISGNEIRSIHNYGVSVTHGSVIEHNRFIDNYVALYLGGGNPSPIVRHNLFYSNGVAIESWASSPTIENNTIDLCGNAILWGCGAIQNNIITRAHYGIYCLSSAVITCNNLFDISDMPYLGIPDQTGVSGNISADPKFCENDNGLNYDLQPNSPCAPGNHPDGFICGLIGAYDVGCKVPVTEHSWGTLKALFGGSKKDTTRSTSGRKQ